MDKLPSDILQQIIYWATMPPYKAPIDTNGGHMAIQMANRALMAATKALLRSKAGIDVFNELYKLSIPDFYASSITYKALEYQGANMFNIRHIRRKLACNWHHWSIKWANRRHILLKAWIEIDGWKKVIDESIMSIHINAQTTLSFGYTLADIGQFEAIKHLLSDFEYQFLSYFYKSDILNIILAQYGAHPAPYEYFKSITNIMKIHYWEEVDRIIIKMIDFYRPEALWPLLDKFIEDNDLYTTLTLIKANNAILYIDKKIENPKFAFIEEIESHRPS
jgi:hypothetical protein